MIVPIAWLSGTAVFCGLISWMLGSGEQPEDESIPFVLYMGAVLWPVVLVMLVVVAPFVAIYLAAKSRAAKAQGR